MKTQSQQVAALRAALPALDAGSQSFAVSLIAGFEKHGSLTAKQEPWLAKLLARATAPKAEAAAIGDLGGILALFDKARKHLKYPAVELGVPGYPLERAIRVSVAGAKAKEPGSLTVATAERFDLGGEYPERKWLGRVTLAGQLQDGNELRADAAYRDAAIARLRAFAADPAKVGGEDGLLHGRCCFCRKALTDERSTHVGYGRKCASNYELPWGEKPAEFAA